MNHPVFTQTTLYKTLRCLFFLVIPFSSLAQAPVNDNCAAASLLTAPTSTCNNINSTLFNATNAAPTGACGGATAATTYDVWFKFTAVATSETITLSSFGNLITPSTTYVQVLSGAGCAGFASLACQDASSGLVVTGLTIATQYYVRVYVTAPPIAGTAVRWSFNICVQNTPPTNDLCSNAVLLTSGGATCNNTAGTVVNSTVTAGDPGSGACTGAVVYDVWYRFTALSTSPTITLSGVGGNFLTPKIELLSGSCGALTIVGCNTGLVYSPAGLTVGNNYYVRIFSTTGVAAPATNGAFNICITDPSPDLCASAIPLVSGTGCTPTGGTLVGSTYTAGPGLPGCGAALLNDVWYTFVAQSTNPTITLTTLMANPRLTLFSGNCGALVSVACGNASISATGLTIGSTYFVRVYTNPNVAGTFTICITDPGRIIGGGNSYVNVSKKTVGGIVQPGDTLEIRSSYFWHQNYDGAISFTRARFYDSIPTKTVMLTPGVGGDTLLRLITNEGLTVSKFSYVNNDDPGAYNLAPGAGRYQIRMNVGALSGNTPALPATAGSLADFTNAGTVDPNTMLPKAGGGTLVTASYFVKVTGVVGDTIQLASSVFSYRKGSNSLDTSIFGTPYKIIISPLGTGLCPNATGLNIASEFSGTFGSGTTKERPTTLAVPIPAYNWRSIVNNNFSLGDGYYSIVNNLSPTGSIITNANSQPNCGTPPAGYECANRMHGGFWDIMGDHTGTNNSIGNPPTAPGATGGYMLAVNADVVMSEAFRQTLSGLCPSTFYEYSAWVKNICKTCGIDANGSSTYKPGVLPNLTFSVDGFDYYSSGSVDTVGWVRKGFVFQTGPAQTTATVAIRNNAPGGGGNDWVMDDIAVSTCLPNMKYSPSLNPNVCRLNPITINDTVQSFFNNYVYYKWQRSTDNGVTWTDATGPLGPAGPSWNGTAWEYVTSYTIPPANTDTTDSGDLYRVIVATTFANLSSVNCMNTDGLSIISLTVNNCGIPLKTDLLSFNGKLVIDKANLSWTTSKEDEPVTFNIERSSDGNNFIIAGSLNSHSNVNSYSFIDPVPVTGKVYYRLAMIDQPGTKKYSRTVQLSRQDSKNFGLVNVINPFGYSIEFDITSPGDAKIEAEVLDMFGKVVKKNSYLVHEGINALSIPNTENLSPGTYILRVKNNEVFINRKLLKKSL
jgi:hypothetical protein